MTPLRWCAWIPLMVLTACSGGGGSDPTDSGTTGPTEVAACELLAELGGCPECADGTITCRFGDTTATELSCGGCQAEAALLQALCDAEEAADRATLEADITCDTPTCEVWYDGCNDPCTALCVPSEGIPSTTCDLGCTSQAEAPGECAWDVATDACQFVPGT